MRSVFWRISASFWLAITLVAGSSILLGRLLNQDAWILKQFPAIQNVAEQWTTIYEQQGVDAAKNFLLEHKKANHIDIQVFAETGKVLLSDTLKPRMPRSKNKNTQRTSLPSWRQLVEEYTSEQTGNSYLFFYRIPRLELAKWHRNTFWLPISALTITLIVLTIFSLLLTFSITKPLNRLREAVKALGRTAYQKNSLANLANRKDEFGLLAKDFSLMGEHLQALIDSQRQLLRDVSHELRSPLARLKITLALLERTSPQDKAKLTSRLSLECDRLENLIAEILTLARLDSVPNNKTKISLLPLLEKLQEDAKVNAPEQQIDLIVKEDIVLNAIPDRLERALDNLIRNALRFNPQEIPLEISAWQQYNQTHITIRDHGTGVSQSYLAEISKPFFRAPGQTTQGYGLGLAISKRAVESHNGHLILSNHPAGGFIAELILPTN